MLTISGFLLLVVVCQQQWSVTLSTRLPLEVYELTSAAAAAATTTNKPNDLQQEQQQQQHKNLVYVTLNAKQQQQQQQQQQKHATDTNKAAAAITTAPPTLSSTTKAAGATTTTTAATAAASVATSINAATQTLDRRRARLMLDAAAADATLLQQQQHAATLTMTQHQSDSHATHRTQHPRSHQQQSAARMLQDVRILYQIGETEEDLPICVPNAVCSKIDLYETPWIERQCRCPTINSHASKIILHHHNNNNDNHNNDDNNSNNADDSLNYMRYKHIGTASEYQEPKMHPSQAHYDDNKYHSYYEPEKRLQRKMGGDALTTNDKHFEHLHLKKLMQKLGAIYEDDLDLQASDFLESNDAPDLNELSSNNELMAPHVRTEEPLQEHQHQQEHNQQQQQQQQQISTALTLSTAHMRHSGHGNHAKPLSYIGGCPSGLGIEDGHTIADKTRHYKLCSPVHKLPVCKHFRDYTWTLTTSAELNVTEQIVHCRCPRNSVTYLTKREPSVNGAGGGFAYLFACSPLTRIRCQRKQPCKLFTVRKRQEFLDEVNINALCQCPKAHHCPSHHTQASVIPGESFAEENIQTYSGYCMAND